MGRFSITENLSSPFEVSYQELVLLKNLVAKHKSTQVRAKQGAMLHASKIRGRGMDYVETRNYFPGDDVRLMDWRVTARTNKPHVKVFEVEKERPVLILLNMSPTMFFGSRICLKSVFAAQLASLLAWTAKAHGDRVGGMLTSMVKSTLLLPHAHNATLSKFLKMVSHATSYYHDKAWNDWLSVERHEYFLRALRKVTKTLKPGTLIIIINDWYEEESLIQSYLYELRSRHDLILYHVNDALERSISGHGVYPISNGQSIKLLNSKYHNNYCAENMQRWQTIANKISVPYYSCSSETDLSLLVRQSLLRSLCG